MRISDPSALRTVNLAVEEQRGTPFDVIVVSSSRTQSSLHNSLASRKFFASNANVALPSTSIANTTPKKPVIDALFSIGQASARLCTSTSWQSSLPQLLQHGGPQRKRLSEG